jgi:hypothetical protein
MVVLIATVAIGLYLLLSVLLGGLPGSRFNRERFLLGCLAGIFLAQFILYGVGVGLCAHLLDQRYAQLRSKGCPEILDRLNDAFESAINATLALLGGAGAVSLGLRRREGQDEPEAGAGSSRGTARGPGAGSGPGPDGP